MTKFVCTKTVYGATVKEGDVIIGELFTQEFDDADVEYIRVTEDSTNLHNNTPRWVVGDEVPLIGLLFEWKAVPSKFVCVRAPHNSQMVQIGDTIEGQLFDIPRNGELHKYIRVLGSGNRLNLRGAPFWSIGERVPLKGSIWSWEEVK